MMVRAAIALLGALLSTATALAQGVEFNPAERQRILRFGPWPPALIADPSNRVSGNPAAIALGRALFFDVRVSGANGISCASCHDPARGWSDGRTRGQGLAEGPRNTQSVLNVRFNRWFGWDGANDNLWAQSLRPILDATEMGGSRTRLAGLLREDAKLACLYRAAFGHAPMPGDEEKLAVDAAKALAAFQETIVSGRSAFDDFRDALAAGGERAVAAAAAYPIDAQRGLKIFIGTGNCHLCHFGPGFSNGEFADIGASYFVAPGKVDPGRHGGIKRLRESRYTLLGDFNDDPARSTAAASRFVALDHRNFGEFRVPGLRDVAATAPYSHNGAKASLHDMIRHYSEVDEERLHADGERLVRPLHLRNSEIDDLVAFLNSLSSLRTPAIAAPTIADCPG